MKIEDCYLNCFYVTTRTMNRSKYELVRLREEGTPEAEPERSWERVILGEVLGDRLSRVTFCLFWWKNTNFNLTLKWMGYFSPTYGWGGRKPSAAFNFLTKTLWSFVMLPMYSIWSNEKNEASFVEIGHCLGGLRVPQTFRGLNTLEDSSFSEKLRFSSI